MIQPRPRRGLVAALALTLSAAGLAVVSTGGAAVASGHFDSAPSVQIGWTDSATPSTPYGWTEGVNMPLGTSTDGTGGSHTSRVYATFDLTQFQDAKIYGGTVFIQESSAADCTKRAIEIWRTEPVGETPSWNRAPQEIAKLDEILTIQSCPGATLSFDVGAAVQDAVEHDRRRVTFEIRVPQPYEGDPAYGRRLNWYKSVGLTVEHNAAPTIDSGLMFNGGFPCSHAQPYRVLGGFARRLEAVGTDSDERDQYRLKTEFAVWPADDPAARTVVSQDQVQSGRVGSVSLPTGTLVDGKSYVWQARVSDGRETSDWSETCFFTYDGKAPSAPTISSENYPSDGTFAPVGVPGVFTFSARGDQDIVGFEYSWADLGVPVCSSGGHVGQTVCTDPFAATNTVRADVPGGSATVTLNPVNGFEQRLTVRAIDLAGNVSAEARYTTRVPWSAPNVRVESGTPQWGQEVRFTFTPVSGMVGVREYEIALDGGQPVTRQAEPDGTAHFSFVADNPVGHRLSVRSRSDNGFVSQSAGWSVFFDPWPGVASDVYFYPPDGHAVGGVGIEGTFTFSPPPGWTDTVAYRYNFGGAPEPTEVPAGADGRATVEWTPSSSGWVDLTVQAVRADGSVSESNWYYFEVAASS
ncbi:hypothetical protein AB0J86_09560 [Micromonospora sp. NPDC049559]|uniref:hypothetical protein n=1 Tax=Micromonospora sp. NPDC049559 TaxID=3155923 RepID=UPI00343730EE